MKFATEEKKKLNEFLDKYEYLLEEGDYVNFLKKYREQNKNIWDALYYAFVDLIKETFNLNIEWFIKNDPAFYWLNYADWGSNITHINIPAGITTIPNRAFTANDTITSVTIGNNITTIGADAFSYCSKLTAVTFSENSQLTSIGNGAFYNCNSLTSITIPDSVTLIGKYTFAYCPSLTSIYIPNSVTTIGYHAFSQCDNLTIYCEASSKLNGWSSDWNSSNCPVIWDYKKK